ncbi:hypothetical protein W97_01425 [Coniosporium apollinis CBS 100218]|uniref:Rhamnogalacturonase A/B/Epimerase-like pectate lyase domain-containing protein n=1 Tax=Coniosporium apollinis (strain CBS 100218) TaxID=1168221 RepID=R7YJY0_CONA1|nr:uncharacterized protein W97_01425 [Coniosporium apollinis CBS 100218]EON62205.1 hypothetical protein W97_01425 [Coniosporium apollinis CBS 100218]
MVAFGTCALLALQLLIASPFSTAAPLAQSNNKNKPPPSYNTTQPPTDLNSTDPSYGTFAASNYWVANIRRQGKAAFHGDVNYKVYRNVKDYGAIGDGNADDTAAINRAISDGNRCGLGCDSSTDDPAFVYFPPGTYKVSRPIIQYYYTGLIGDALQLPVLKAAPNFEGMAVVDADPYTNTGANWYTNQNNFFRQIRNFVIDTTAMPQDRGAGIHWQVAQATSLQNIRFEMVRGGGAANKQLGIFMDNGSGGFMTDLTFNGGNYGAFLGSQQFTTRNMVFNGCNTAIFMNWNWAWTLKSISINNCKVGIDMANGGFNQTVGSVLVQDSKISNTPIGILTSFNAGSLPNTGGTLIVDNVEFQNCPDAIRHPDGTRVLAGNTVVQAWGQGRRYVGAGGERIQRAITPPVKPAALMGAGGKIFERSKPQYENVPVANFVSIKDKGARGDGNTDDTDAIQRAMNGLGPDQILYFDHGAYVITRTIVLPPRIKITGEFWPLIMASGPFFADQNALKPVWQVGKAGEQGAVEISDLIFQTKGPAPGAILMQWNLAGAAGANGLWDVHFRVAGTAGTQLQADKCTKNPGAPHGANPACMGAGMLFHIARTGSVYVENCWFWVADHELDQAPYNQIDIYNGRGVLIESQGPVWMYGTASEHNVLYNYQLNNAKNVYMALIQTETPYYQGNPDATTPYTPQTAIKDPDFRAVNGAGVKKAWGLRVIDSSDFLLYGGGLYSFFENYNQDCLRTESCQANMVSIEGSANNVHLFGLSTKASVNMVTRNGVGQVFDRDNRSNFCGTIMRWLQ